MLIDKSWKKYILISKFRKAKIWLPWQGNDETKYIYRWRISDMNTKTQIVRANIWFPKHIIVREAACKNVALRSTFSSYWHFWPYFALPSFVPLNLKVHFFTVYIKVFILFFSVKLYVVVKSKKIISQIYSKPISGAWFHKKAKEYLTRKIIYFQCGWTCIRIYIVLSWTQKLCYYSKLYKIYVLKI